MNLTEAIEQLNKVAFTDDKTPLENALALNKEVTLIDKGQSKFDVIVFGDLNDFKLFNTNHKHEAGDVAIRKVGEVPLQMVRRQPFCNLLPLRVSSPQLQEDIKCQLLPKSRSAVSSSRSRGVANAVASARACVLRCNATRRA